jgi:hypothetical protein
MLIRCTKFCVRSANIITQYIKNKWFKTRQIKKKFIPKTPPKLRLTLIFHLNYKSNILVELWGHDPDLFLGQVSLE